MPVEKMAHLPVTMSSADREPKASIAAAFTATIVLWGSVFPAIRIALDGFDPGQMSVSRYLIASVALLCLATVAPLRRPNTFRELGRLLLLGATGTAGYSLALGYGEVTLTASAASLVYNATPILTGLLATMVLRERMPVVGWLGVLMGAVGVAIISVAEAGGDLHFGPGAWLVLLATLLQAITFVLQKSLLREGWSGFDTTAYGIWFGTALLLPFAPSAFVAAQLAPIHSLAAVAYMALLPGLVAYLLWSYALTHTQAGRSASLLYLLPLVAVALDVLGGTHWPSPATLAGGFVTFAGAALVNTARTK